MMLPDINVKKKIGKSIGQHADRKAISFYFSRKKGIIFVRGTKIRDGYLHNIKLIDII